MSLLVFLVLWPCTLGFALLSFFNFYCFAQYGISRKNFISWPLADDGWLEKWPIKSFVFFRNTSLCLGQFQDVMGNNFWDHPEESIFFFLLFQEITLLKVYKQMPTAFVDWHALIALSIVAGNKGHLWSFNVLSKLSACLFSKENCSGIDIRRGFIFHYYALCCCT